MNSFIPFVFMFCMLSETVVSVSVLPDKPYPINGDQVILTCSITGFSVPATWSDSAAVLTTCIPGGPCSPASLGKYSFSANASAIVVQISSFASSDNFGWKCQHDVNTTVFTFVFTTTTTSTPSTSTTTTTFTMTTTPVSTTNTEMTTTNTEMTTTNSEMETISITAAPSCSLPDFVIIGISVSGFLSILLIIFCCCFYHSRKEQHTDKFEDECVETNDNEVANNHSKSNVATRNPTHIPISARNESGTSDTFKEVKLIDGILNAPVQSSRLSANQTNKDLEDKPVPDMSEFTESEQL